MFSTSTSSVKVETIKLNNIIKNLEKDIAGLKKEIQERDETIQDKVSWLPRGTLVLTVYHTIA